MKLNYYMAGMVLILGVSCNDDDCLTGSGGTVTEEITPDDFVAVQVAGSFDVNIIQDANQRIVATGDASVVEALETEVSSGTVIVKLPDGCVTDFNLEVDVYTPVLEAVGSAGSGNVDVGEFSDLENVLVANAGSGNLRSSGLLTMTGELELANSGSGNVSLEISAESLNVLQTGSGNIELEGEVQLQNVTKSGSGDYRCYDLESDNCAVTSTGSGNAEVTVNEGLTVRLAGSGDVRYRGMPTVEAEVTGSGRVIDDN